MPTLFCLIDWISALRRRCALGWHAASVNARGHAGTADYRRTMVSSIILGSYSSRVTRNRCFGVGRPCQALVDSAIDFLGPNGQPTVMPFNDQGSFAKALTEWDRTPFILPMNWNFRPAWHRTFFGPIKIWHDYRDPPPALRQLNATYRNQNAIIQFHVIS